MGDLRSKVIRLAHAEPRLRADLLPLLKTAFDLSEYNLEGLTKGTPVTLYHGTTKTFHTFSLEKSREELVKNFYGTGIFLTPDKRVAMKYANANRNIGFDPSIIDTLKRKNPGAGAMMEALYNEGADAWETFPKAKGFWRENPPPGEGSLDLVGLEAYLKGIDPNTLSDVVAYVLGSKVRPLGMDEGPSLFNTGTGAPDWVYDALDKLGLNSKIYRPKIYTVVVTAKNPLITKSQALARKAHSNGFDSVVYYGPDLVAGVPEVAVFNPRNVKIRSVEIL